MPYDKNEPDYAGGPKKADIIKIGRASCRERV